MKILLPLIAACALLVSCDKMSPLRPDLTVTKVMDDVITRLYAEVPPEKYDSIDDTFILKFLTAEEKAVLSRRYQYFTVNTPVTVSLMRDTGQKIIPFWLEESGFARTEQVVKNESYTYEVWQKKYPAGKVELGINGFDKHRPVYFISIAPQDPNSSLSISDIFPAYEVSTLQAGAFTYHDWSGLVLTEIPEQLVGQKLFTTVRGRAREAHVINAFRKTPYPSTGEGDHVMLTWSGSPKTTIDIQWRTNTTVPDGVVRYWIEGRQDTLVMSAERAVIQDRMLFNDRYMHRFTCNLKYLKPGTHYHYQIGSKANSHWSVVNTFDTEPADEDKFSFIWFGDTHCFPDSGKLISLAAQHQDAAFYSIAGDLVSTGLNRDDWDRLFEHSKNSFARKPLMPVPGNHDRQDGLGAKLYYDLFSLPKNGPEKVDTESSYSFEYGNALFIMIDATSSVGDHSSWLEQTLSQSKAAWKFVMFHFPPYNFEEPYLDIQEAWVPLFDKYHVDMVIGGHIHYYMRSNPMYNGKVVGDFSKGTVYAISISIPSRHDRMTAEPYAVRQYSEGYFYQHMEIEGNTLKYVTMDSDGQVKDEFTIHK
ncbi:MAG TPA: metallophosphoesterase family protein [Chryseolinea sp.]